MDEVLARIVTLFSVSAVLYPSIGTDAPSVGFFAYLIRPVESLCISLW